MAMAANLLRLSLSAQPKLSFSNDGKLKVDRFDLLLRCRRSRLYYRPRSTRGFVLFNSLETRSQSQESSLQPPNRKPKDSSVLLDVNGMMCGGCVSRVKSVISSDERVDSVVVNLLTESAAIKLKSDVIESESVDSVAESIAQRVTECGFMAKRRVSGLGIGENVRKWKEMLKKKEELLVKSRNRVAFAWTLVALCCGAHASHILHSLGIHIVHGSFLEVLHNSYVKGGLALAALLGPGRDLLVDGLMAFKKGSPNMNSLVGFGSIAAFIISAVSLLSPGLEWDASFFDEPYAGHASWFCAPGTFSGRKSEN